MWHFGFPGSRPDFASVIDGTLYLVVDPSPSSQAAPDHSTATVRRSTRLVPRHAWASIWVCVRLYRLVPFATSPTSHHLVGNMLQPECVSRYVAVTFVHVCWSRAICIEGIWTDMVKQYRKLDDQIITRLNRAQAQLRDQSRIASSSSSRHTPSAPMSDAEAMCLRIWAEIMGMSSSIHIFSPNLTS